MSLMAMAVLIAAQSADTRPFFARAKLAGVAATSVASCTRLGFTVDQDGLAKWIEATPTEGIYAGIDADVASAFVHGAIKTEGDNMRALSDGAQTASDGGKRLVDFWQARCVSLTRNPETAAFFKL